MMANGPSGDQVTRKIVISQDLAEISEIAQRHIRTDYLIGHQIYVDFWEGTLASTKMATCYFAVLYSKLLSFETGDDKLGQYVDILRKFVNTNWATMASERITLTNPPEIRNNILQTLYFLLIFYDIDVDFPPLRALLELGRTAFLSQVRSFAEEVTRLALSYNTRQDLLMTYLVEKAISISNDSLEGSINDFDSPEHSFCLVNMALRERCLHSDDAKLIYEDIIHLLRSPQFDTKSLAIMHLVRQVVSLPPPTKHTAWMVQNSIPFIKKKFLLWPQPWCELASQLLKDFTIETKAPGTLFRSIFLREYPGLLSTNEKTGKENLAHILIDQNVPSGIAIEEILRTQPSGEATTENLQYALLAQIFELELKMDPEMIGLEFIDKSDLQQLFDSAMSIYSNAIKMTEEEALVYRREQFTTLKDFAISKCVSTKKRAFIPKVIRPPPLTFQVFPIIPDVSAPKPSTDASIPHRVTTDLLTHIFNQYILADRKEKPTVRIVVIGDDTTMHAVSWSYINLRVLIKDLPSRMNVLFYFIPLRASVLASYLCSVDAWYARQVVGLPSTSLRTIPGLLAIPRGLTTGLGTADAIPLSSLIENAHLMIHKTTSGFNPAKLLRRGMQAYLREANYPCNITAFQCECWLDANSQSSYIVPFLIRVELGSNVTALAQTKPSTLKPQMTHPLGVKFTMMSPALIQRSAPPLEPRQYFQIILANLPSPSPTSERGAPPSPLTPYLEMTLETDPKRRRERAANYHVSVAEIESQDPNKKFDILIDNVLYGPCYKIKITITEEQIRIPVMIFNPVSSF